MTDKEQIAPSLEDLSHAQVESSRVFGFTNLSGKALALVSLSSLGAGGAGVAQGLGYLGPVMGASLTFPAGLAVLGASVVTGLLGYWLGNFDDKQIKAHNSRASQAFHSARGTMYQKIERGFMQALTKVAYDPKENSLPYDALGHAVLLTDEKIGQLPAHVQLDIYRTQLDLELYKHKGLTGHSTREGRQFEAATMVEGVSMEDKAAAYRRGRDQVREKIRTGTLTATAIAGGITAESDDYYDAGIGADVAEAISDVLGAASRSSRNASSGGWGGGGFKGGGGGSFGGGGASGSWGAPAGAVQPVQAPPVMVAGFGTNASYDAPVSAASFGSGFDRAGSSGGSKIDFNLGDIDGDSAGPLLVIAGVAAVVAATAVAGFSVWKNFVSAAEIPALGNVHLPMITKSLASAEKDIRRMYAPK